MNDRDKQISADRKRIEDRNERIAKLVRDRKAEKLRQKHWDRIFDQTFNRAMKGVLGGQLTCEQAVDMTFAACGVKIERKEG